MPTSNPADLHSGFPMADCIRAEAKISKLLRENIGDTRVSAEQLLIAMLPAFKAEKKIEITENAVRAAIEKVLRSDE